jgi:hypothetical protein
MKRWLGRLGAAAFALLVLGSGRATADPSYSYSWDQSPTTIAADGTGTGSISLSVGKLTTGVGNSTIVAANLSAVTSTVAPAVDTFTNKAYSLTLTLTDAASSQVGTFVFHGLLNGTINTTSSNLTNAWTGASTLTEKLGNFNYTVSLGNFVPPPIVNGALQGAISAQLTASPASSGGGGNPPPPQQAPEPTSLLLAGLGVGPALLAGLRRRRAA